MPAERHVDPSSLDALAATLTRSSIAVLEASYELLAHYSETGAGPSQRAVDALVDQAAETLRGHADSLAEVSSALEHRA
jgi:hypothetical protein